MSSTKFTVTV